MVLIPAGIGPPFSKIPPVDFVLTGDFLMPRFGLGAFQGFFEAGFADEAVLANFDRITRPELSTFFGAFLEKIFK